MTIPTTITIRKHGFMLAMAVAVILALLFPEPGEPGGLLRVEWTTKLGVWIVFLLQGASLPARELGAGYRPLRLQAFVLGWNYLVFPGVTFLALCVGGRFLPEEIALGFGLLSILPTTIASAVAFTGLAGGRSSNALCATVLSNMLAIVVVPFWVALYLATGESVALPMAPLLTKLALLIVFPMLLGQIVRLALPRVAASIGAWGKRVISAIIVFIVYAAFAGSVASGFFVGVSAADMVLLLAAATCLLLWVSWLVWHTAAWLRCSPSERIAAFYCASQKSLATGLPLATAIFAVLPASVDIRFGAVILPLILYHPLQLLLAAMLAGRFAEPAVE